MVLFQHTWHFKDKFIATLVGSGGSGVACVVFPIGETNSLLN